MSNFNLIRPVDLEEIDCGKQSDRHKSDSIKFPFFVRNIQNDFKFDITHSFKILILNLAV